jgi:3-hydroxyisobutyrate dehydrogenase-like beta-hydroxyacid dehydrogenase
VLDSKRASKRPRLGFIGIGLMGEAMTRRLLDQGWRISVWNLEPERVDTVVPFGAVPCSSPAVVAEASDIVLVCVLHTQAVENCVFGERGIAQARAAPRILVDFSTIDPAATRKFASRLRESTGIGWVDAPVSGGPDGARKGELTVMAGGAESDVEAVRSVIACLATNCTRMGEVGAGQTTKMVNQAIVGAGFVVMAEALALAERSGIDAARLPACLSGGFADSGLLRKIYPQMQARAFDPPKGYARQLLKDLNALSDFARGLGLDLPMVETARRRYTMHVERGNAMRDTATIIETYKQ